MDRNRAEARQALGGGYGRIRTRGLGPGPGLSLRRETTAGLRYARTSVERQPPSNCSRFAINRRRLSADRRRLSANRRRLSANRR